MKTIEENEKKFGSVDFNGETYILSQYAHMDIYRDDIRFYASGINPKTGDRVIIAWEISSEWDKLCEICGRYEALTQAIKDSYYQNPEELAKLKAELAAIEADYDGIPEMPNDESAACDWDNPIDVAIID
jgi:hypothetical protein